MELIWPSSLCLHLCLLWSGVGWLPFPDHQECHSHYSGIQLECQGLLNPLALQKHSRSPPNRDWDRQGHGSLLTLRPSHHSHHHHTLHLCHCRGQPPRSKLPWFTAPCLPSKLWGLLYRWVLSTWIVLVPLILLNMLIAIMGDTFDRVKETRTGENQRH